MKEPKPVLVTVRRQTKAVIGYVTAMQTGTEAFGIMGDRKTP
jgi:hypothetical protein